MNNVAGICGYAKWTYRVFTILEQKQGCCADEMQF